MWSDSDSWSVPFFALMTSAWLLFKLLCVLIFFGVMTFLIGIGPVVSLTGYVASLLMSFVAVLADAA